jgi:TolA-binding protein
MKLGLARQRQEQFPQALEAYDQLLSNHPDSPHALQARFERGQVLRSLDRDEEAASAFEKVLADGAESRFTPYVENHLGSIALERGDFKGAAKHFERASGASADTSVEAHAAMQRGLALMADSRYGDAEKAFDSFLSDHADSARATEARAQRAISVSRQDRFAEALKLIEEVGTDLTAAAASAADGPSLSSQLAQSLLYEKAWCLRKTENTDASAEAYRSLLEVCKDRTLMAHALLELAGIETDHGKHQTALPLLTRLVALSSGEDSKINAALREQGLYRLGVCRFQLEEFASSVESFEAFLDSFPSSSLVASASLFCGEALVKTDRHVRAIDHFERVVESSEKPADEVFEPSLLRLGESLSVLQRWADSEKTFANHRERFKQSKQWYQAQFGIGWAQENQGRLDEAMKSYAAVVDRHKGPTAARAQFQIGECLFAKERYKEAVAEFLKVDILYAYPEWSSAAVFEAGRCFERLNQPGQARKQFESVVERYKDSRWARLASARLEQLSSNSIIPGR